MADKKVALNITSAVAIGGKIIVPSSPDAKGILVEETLAKNLLHRGRAELATDNETDDDDDDKPLADMNVAELKTIANGLGIDGADGMKKAELIKAIEKAESE